MTDVKATETKTKAAEPKAKSAATAETKAVLSDRQDWKQLEDVPTLEDILRERPGVVVVKSIELATGDQRRLYMDGFVMVEVDADGTVARAYSLLPMAAKDAEPK